jgi:hypothetical protein
MTGDPVCSMREFRPLTLANVDGILNLDPSVCTLTDDTGKTKWCSDAGATSCNVLSRCWLGLDSAFFM